jgi:hypothetical protein
MDHTNWRRDLVGAPEALGHLTTWLQNVLTEEDQKMAAPLSGAWSLHSLSVQ